jgi:hypothetical protein
MDIRNYDRTYLSSNGSTDWSQIVSFLIELDQKLEFKERQLQYYDLYKFIRTVDSEDQLAAAESALYPNTAFIVNSAQKITKGSETYVRGDIVIKMNDGTIKHVPAQSGGFWYPYRLYKIGEESSVNTYQLCYAWSDSAPTGDVRTISAKSKEDNPNLTPIGDEQISYKKTILQYDAEKQSNIYGLSFNSGDPFEVSAVKDGDNTIYPVAKCYAANGEEVICDLKYTFDGTTFKYNWPASVVAKIVIK